MDHSDHYDSMHYPDLNFVGNRAILPKQKFERAFKMIKNGVYFIVIAILVAELVKMTCIVTSHCGHKMNQKSPLLLKSQKMESL